MSVKPIKIVEWTKASYTYRLVRLGNNTLEVERKTTDALGELCWIAVGWSDNPTFVLEGLIDEVVRLRAELVVLKVNASGRATDPGPGPLP